MGEQDAREAIFRAQQRRACRALLIVLVTCSAMFLLLSAAERAPAATADDAGATEELVSRLLEGAGLASAMEEAGFVTLDERTAPAWFAQEVMPFTRVQECYATAGLDAVFLSVQRSSDEGFDTLHALFEEQGWQVVTDDGMGMLSLMKDGGMCRWMTVSAREGEAEWDAALRIQHASSERSIQRKEGDGS